MKKIAPLVALAMAVTFPAVAAPSPEAARVAIQRYAATAKGATTISALKSHWSSRFVRENDVMYAQQVAPLPAETRVLVERRLVQGIAEVAQGSLNNLSVSCTPSICTASAVLPNGITQTYRLVEERGMLVIDGASMSAGR